MKIVGCDYSSSLTNGLINHITDPRDRLNQDQLDLDIIEDNDIDLVRNEQVNIRFQERDEVGVNATQNENPKRKRGDDDDDDIDNVRKQRVHSFMERVKVDNVNLFDHPMFEQTFGGDGGPRGDRPRGDRPRRPIIIPNPFMKREKIDRFGMIKDHSLESIVEDGVWILGINRKDEEFTSFINDCWRRLIDRFNRGHKGRRLSIPTIRDHNHDVMLSIYSEESYRIFGDCGDPAGVYPILKDLCNRIRHDEHFQIDDAVNKLIDCMGLINY